MIHKKRRKTIGDFSRVLGPEPLSHLGNLMIRQPQYFRGFFLLLMGMAWKRANYGNALASVIALICTRTIGMALKFGPAFFLNRLKKTAQRAGYHFNVAQKRCAVLGRQRCFWDYVYEQERRTLYTDEEIAQQQTRESDLDHALHNKLHTLPRWVRRDLHCLDDGLDVVIEAIKEVFPVSPGIEMTEQGFYTTFRHAFTRDYDRETQTLLTGINVNPIEDYLCTPIMSEMDVFPRANLASNRLIQQARKRMRRYTAYARIDGLPFGVGGHGALPRWVVVREETSRNIWHAMVTNVIAKRTGTGILKLFNEYGAEQISVQTLLWQGCESAPWTEKYPGLREDVFRLRRRMIDQAFGCTHERTEVMLERLTRWDERQAMELRACYDLQYCNPEESVNLWSDYRRLEDYDTWLPGIRVHMDAALRMRDTFSAWLQRKHALWGDALDRSLTQRMVYAGRHYTRLIAFAALRSPALQRDLIEWQDTLEPLLLSYHARDDLRTAGLPDHLVRLCHAYAKSLRATCRDLFSLPNREQLRAVLNAFHANMSNMRTHFNQMEDLSLKTHARTKAAVNVRYAVLSTIRQTEVYSQELRELRNHHAICVVQSLIYREFIDRLCQGPRRKRDRTIATWWRLNRMKLRQRAQKWRQPLRQMLGWR